MITFDIDTNERLILCRARRGVGVLDVANYLQALARDPRFNPSFDALIVVEDSESVPPLSMLRYLNPLIAAWSAKRGDAKWAFVLPTVGTRTLVETHLSRLALNAIQARCFISEQVARKWLTGSV